MGKGKSSSARRLRAKMKKPEPKLDAEFNCLFCNSHKSVYCTIPKLKSTREFSIGLAQCRICEASYRTRVCRLTNPIDVYTEWFDECVWVNSSYQECQDTKPMHARRQWIPPHYDQIDEDEGEEDVEPPAKILRTN